MQIADVSIEAPPDGRVAVSRAAIGWRFDGPIGTLHRSTRNTTRSVHSVLILKFIMYQLVSLCKQNQRMADDLDINAMFHKIKTECVEHLRMD